MNILNHAVYILILASLVSASADAQELSRELTETYYYTKYWQKSNSRKAYAYRTPVEKNGELYHVNYYHANGKLIYEGNVKPRLVDGKNSLEPFDALKEGKFTYYYSSGLIFAKAEYKNNIPVGERIEYYDTSSRIMSVIKYDGENTASVVNYHKDGKTKKADGKLLKMERNGRIFYKEDGVWTYYYMHPGTVFAIAHYDEGLLDGAINYFDSLTANKIIEGQYMLDKRVGKWRYYFADSMKRMGIANFEHDLLYGDFYLFYPSGRLKMAGLYINGVKTGLWSSMYDKTNTILWQGDYKDNKAFITYYDSVDNNIGILEGSIENDMRIGEWIGYYKTGKQVKYRENYENNLLHGRNIYYTKDGRVLSELTFYNGLKNGESIYYYEGTKVKRAVITYYNDTVESIRTYYSSGKLKRVKNGDANREICYAENGEITQCEPFITAAAFDGDVMTYMGDNLVYPVEAKQNRLEGKVKIGFVIDEYGKVQDPFIVEGFDGRCDEEALKLVSQMPLWISEKIEGIPVRSYKTLPVVFWLQTEADGKTDAHSD